MTVQPHHPIYGLHNLPLQGSITYILWLHTINDLTDLINDLIYLI